MLSISNLEKGRNLLPQIRAVYWQGVEGGLAGGWGVGWTP